MSKPLCSSIVVGKQSQFIGLAQRPSPIARRRCQSGNQRCMRFGVLSVAGQTNGRGGVIHGAAPVMGDTFRILRRIVRLGDTNESSGLCQALTNLDRQTAIPSLRTERRKKLSSASR